MILFAALQLLKRSYSWPTSKFCILIFKNLPHGLCKFQDFPPHVSTCFYISCCFLPTLGHKTQSFCLCLQESTHIQVFSCVGFTLLESYSVFIEQRGWNWNKHGFLASASLPFLPPALFQPILHLQGSSLFIHLNVSSQTLIAILGAPIFLLTYSPKNDLYKMNPSEYSSFLPPHLVGMVNSW